MIRAKGGKRQPRYFHLKNAAAERLCRLLEIRSEPELQKVEIEPDDSVEAQIAKLEALREKFETEVFSLQIQIWSGIY